LWPGVVAAVLLCVLRFGVPILAPDLFFYSLIGAMVCAAAIVVWWLFFSRATWSERIAAIVLMPVALFVTSRVVDVSIRTAMMGMMLPVYAAFILPPALVAWAVVTRRLSDPLRRMTMVATVLLACGAFTLFRSAGIKGGGAELTWRWSKTPEERLLARAGDEVIPLPPAPPKAETPKEPITPPRADETPDSGRAATTDSARVSPPTPPSSPAPERKPAEWPGFRGPNRDDVIRGVRINTDWTASPPVQLWRRPIGPGWSSFAVEGDLFYTQEQRGEQEIVACYKVSTGEPVWRHRDSVRFWESNGGAGPRATPTLSNGRVYAFGATGVLNVLDAGSGAVMWSRNVASDSTTKVPTWGFSSSPLVIDDTVIVAASSKLVAYELAGGKPRWVGASHHGSYSSPHRATIDGVVQVLLLSADGVTSVVPADGMVLWQHAWGDGTPIVQPALTEDGDVLINAIASTGGMGIRRLAVKRGPGGWTVEERWTSNGLKPYFNDFVVHKGYAFGFDGSILSCIDLADGKRKWKGGRYGDGQLVLLADQDLLLVTSEDGELALVAATPDQFKELARVPAIEGKTWNHPVLVRDVLLVRNGEEMAAYRLSLAGH
jgi:outer membrane protein assembly factor BamB